jgi:hypothetical protein
MLKRFFKGRVMMSAKQRLRTIGHRGRIHIAGQVRVIEPFAPWQNEGLVLMTLQFENKRK